MSPDTQLILERLDKIDNRLGSMEWAIKSQSKNPGTPHYNPGAAPQQVGAARQNVGGC